MKGLFDRGEVKGEITIRHIRNGEEVKGFQEYKLFHFLRKHFGIKMPKILLLTGFYKFGVTYSNLIVTAGRGLISGRINGVGAPAAPTYMAIGTGTNAAAAGDTALQTESYRVAGTATLVTTTVANDTCQLVGTFSITGSSAITEMGILNAASVGTLLVRNVFSAYNVQNGDTFEITHKLKNA